MYDEEGVNRLIGKVPTSKRGYVYARVSSAKQKGDLARQIDDLKKAYPDHDVIHDVASGVNFKRKGLQALLELVFTGMVSEVVVAHRDRLARLGCDLLETIFTKLGTKLVVHGASENEDEHDLASDLLAVTTVLVASYNGRRSAENRKRRNEESTSSKKAKTQIRESSSSQESKDIS